MSTPHPTLPANATDAERETFAAEHRARYLAAKQAREDAKAAKLMSMLNTMMDECDWRTA